MKIAGIVVVSSLLIVLLIRSAGSQPTIAERSEILPGPRTRLEAITGSSGAVLVRQYTEVGLLGHGAISVAAIMVTNVTSETETKGLLISPSEGTGGMRNAYVDYDEIPGLLSGIDYLGDLSPSSTSARPKHRARCSMSSTAYTGFCPLTIEQLAPELRADAQFQKSERGVRIVIRISSSLTPSDNAKPCLAAAKIICSRDWVG